MIPDQPNIKPTEDQEADADLTPESITRAAMTLEDAVTPSPQSEQSSEAGPGAGTVPQEEVADLSSQLAERGVDLGTLLTAVMAASSQSKPKPKPTAAKDAAGDDPAVLLGKLAKSLGISPAELMKRLGPALKEMLSGQGVKPRRKPKKETAKPAAKPKPKPKTTSKPKKETTKPAAKPKSKPKAASKSEPIAQ